MQYCTNGANILLYVPEGYDWQKKIKGSISHSWQFGNIRNKMVVVVEFKITLKFAMEKSVSNQLLVR